MTWADAFRQGRFRWLVWTAICAALGCCFLVKGGTTSELLWAFMIGAANGIAVGFAFGPAAAKNAATLSGVFAGTPFYFIAVSAFVIEAVDAHELHRGIPSDAVAIVSLFLGVGAAFSFAQALRVRGNGRWNVLP